VYGLDPDRDEHGTTQAIEQDFPQNRNREFAVACGCIFD